MAALTGMGEVESILFQTISGLVANAVTPDVTKIDVDAGGYKISSKPDDVSELSNKLDDIPPGTKIDDTNIKTNFDNEIPRTGEEWNKYLQDKYGADNVSWVSGNGSKATIFKEIEITTNNKGELTNGVYTLNQQDMLIHVDGHNPNKSQFLYDVDANKAVLDAAVYADTNSLWVSSSGNIADFANKAKVPVTNGYVGVTGKGELTIYINVYRTKTGYIHGCPGN